MSEEKKETKSKLFDIDELVKEFNISIYEAASLKRFKRWLPNKKVSRKEFEEALKELRERRV